MPVNGHESDEDVTSALSQIRVAGENAKDSYYREHVSETLKAKIYTGSDVIFTSSSTATNNDIMIVKNKKGQPLPNTGGPGTVMFMIAGALLIVLAIGGLILTTVKKRRASDTEH